MKNFALFFVTLNFFNSAYAQSNTKLVENETLMATQSYGYNMFVSNPAMYQPKSLTLGYANVIKSSDVRREDSDDSIKSLGEDDIKQLGLATSMGAGSALIFDGYFWKDTLRSTHSSSGFATRPAEEYRIRKGFGAKFGVEIAKGIRLGAGLRYHTTNATVLGSFFVPQGETTQYKGSLLGLNLGGVMTSGDITLGLAYATPLGGKVESSIENKVTIVPGWMIGDFSYNINNNVILGVVIRKWKFESDQMRETTTTPNTTSRVLLLGLSPEATFYPDLDAGIGIDFNFNKVFGLRTTGFYNQAEFISDTSAFPGKESNKDNRVTYYSVRSALVLNHRDVDIHVGAYYAQRKSEFESRDGSGVPIKYEGKDLDYFATLRLVF